MTIYVGIYNTSKTESVGTAKFAVKLQINGDNIYG